MFADARDFVCKLTAIFLCFSLYSCASQEKGYWGARFLYWTCQAHPGVVRTSPDRCYICRAKLIKGGNEAVPAENSDLLSYCRRIVRDNLEDPQPAGRRLAIAYLEPAFGEEARKELIRFLSDESLEVRVEAAVRLGYLGDKESLPTIRAVIKTEELPSFDRIELLGALHRLGDDTALPSLAKALVDPDVNVRCWAISQIVSVEEKSLYDALRARLAEADPTYDERVHILGALGKLGFEEAAEGLEKYLQAKYPAQRELAAKCLSVIKVDDKIVVPILENMVQHRDLRVRICGAAGMKRRGREPFIEIIKDALYSDDAAAALYAAYALEEVGEEKHIPLLAKLLRTSHKLHFAPTIAHIIRRSDQKSGQQD